MNRPQRGAVLIEFALVLLLFLMFVLGIVDFSRMLFTWNAATEATRAGARHAVVCDDTMQAASVRDRMREMLPQVQSVSVQWSPPGCNAATCERVQVSITALDYQWISPIVGAVAPRFPMPAFSTTLVREAMRQDPHSSTLCP